MDTTYRLIVECVYSDMGKYNEKDKLYVQKDGKWGILRITDQTFIYPAELTHKPEYENGFFCCAKRG